ncbi:MAG TPA: hypothetical protein IGR64_06860 [Leptolyngbyaceae cyanobacterium M65_K2018_010]|nr:hypothetical protein [Leptolyngbyaceae cyanobacterium M65_K2018_010]
MVYRFGQPTTVKLTVQSYTRMGWRSLILGGAVASLLGSTPSQAAFPPCPPPQANEYLLLVRGNTEAERNRVQDLLPSNTTVMVCDYLSDTVVRAGGFTNLENANAWAQYMTEVEGLQAFVARPAPTSQPPNPTVAPPTTNGSTVTTPGQPTTPSQPQLAYAPQPLNDGFAVLVDYNYQPEMAKSIQQKVGQAVGLAVYQQRPYLLIAYSPDIAGAASTLTVLSGLGISGFIVDSLQVVMLTPAVVVPD